MEAYFFYESPLSLSLLLSRIYVARCVVDVDFMTAMIRFAPFWRVGSQFSPLSPSKKKWPRFPIILKKKINERTTTRNNTGKRQRYQMILKTLNGHFQSELSIEQFIKEAKKMAKNFFKKMSKLKIIQKESRKWIWKSISGIHCTIVCLWGGGGKGGGRVILRPSIVATFS